MKQTERLYGVSPSKYADLQIALCTIKVEDAIKLITVIRKDLDTLDFSDTQVELQARLEDVKAAIVHNRLLIDEAKGVL